MKTQNKLHLATVILKDRVGIMRDVTGAICEAGGNLTDLRMNVVVGMFVLNCVAEFSEAIDADALRRAIVEALPEKAAQITVVPLPMATKKSGGIAPTDRFVAAVSGLDKPGRVYKVAAFFAARGVNVEDWKHDFSNPPNALTIGIVTIPKTADLAKLQRELADEMSKDGLKASLTHENIFRATNEVGPIEGLRIKD